VVHEEAVRHTFSELQKNEETGNNMYIQWAFTEFQQWF